MIELIFGALKLLYEFAKMVKEAKDNVMFVREKLQSTEALEEILDRTLNQEKDNIPDNILNQIDIRIVRSKRIARRMRLKYEPLISLLSGLGGSASFIGAKTTIFRRGILGVVMAIGTLSKILRRHVETLEERMMSTVALASGSQRQLTESITGNESSNEAIIVANQQQLAKLLETENGLPPQLSHKFQGFEEKLVDAARNMTSSLEIPVLTEGQSHVGSIAVSVETSVAAIQFKYEKVHAMLDDFDAICNELKQIMEQSAEVDESEKATAEAQNDFIPMRTDKYGNPIAGKPAKSFLEEGDDLILDRIMKDKSAEYVDEKDLETAMGDAFSKPRLNVLKRYLGDSFDQQIPMERFKQFLSEECRGDIAFLAIRVLLILLTRLESTGMPAFVQEAVEIVFTLVDPLINFALSFGFIVVIESIREEVKEDPEEVAALQAEADEEAMANRMELIKAFSVDFKEAFEYGYTPDPSLIASLAMECSNCFIGLGPTTKRRVQILLSILNILNVDDDKKHIEAVDNDLKSELLVIRSVGKQNTTETLAVLQELHEDAFDARRIIKDKEMTEFWVGSFGKSCAEVPWSRFRLAFTAFFGNATARELEKLKITLLDGRGIVTLVHLIAFVGREGSIRAAFDALKGIKGKSSRNITDLANIPPTPSPTGAQRALDLSDPSSIEGTEGLGAQSQNGQSSFQSLTGNAADSSSPSRTLSRSNSRRRQPWKDEDSLTPTERRQAKNRLYGVLQRADFDHAVISGKLENLVAS